MVEVNEADVVVMQSDLELGTIGKFIEVKIIELKHMKGLEFPRYETVGSSGMDLRAAIDTKKVIKPGHGSTIQCGFKLEIPSGFEAQIRSRSGLAVKFGVAVLNSPGTIDSDYRGEIKVILFNHGSDNFIIERGDRIAQMVFQKILHVGWVVTDQELKETDRGEDGFGSTGQE